jgi:TRAP-type C4-dicarboxylate transport system substrate-binding protein
VPNGKTFINTVAALGGSPVPIDWSETFSALQQGVVDGQDKVNLRAKLMKRLQEEAYSRLTANLAAKDFIPPDSLVVTVLEEEFDRNPSAYA